jgi:hypothetical protein
MAGKSAPTVTLMIPGLAPFSSAQWQELKQRLPALPALTDLLNQSRISRNPANASYETMLSEKFGLSVQPLPVAALTYWHDIGRPPAKHVLRADPVYLKADRDCLFLLGRHGLQLSLEEAESLAADINKLYEDLPWSMEIGTAERWYICSEEDFNIATRSLNDVFGKNLQPYLPEGDAKTQWRAIFNEMQMLLHSNEVNHQREMNRQLPVNSLWLWGEGELPPTEPLRNKTHDQVNSNDAFCRGLANWAQCGNASLPDTANEWFEQNSTGQHLLVFDDMRILAREDFSSWESNLIRWEKNWLAPLRDAVQRKQIQLTIESDNGFVFVCNSPRWNRIWNKKRNWYEWFQ